jgi:hypothetical protein
MEVAAVRRWALSLPEATEEPHFDMSSFRVRGKIFATIAPEETTLHLFVDEPEIRASVAAYPAAFDELWWGKKLRGVRVNLRAAGEAEVFELLEEAWRRKAPKRLVGGQDAQHL